MLFVRASRWLRSRTAGRNGRHHRLPLYTTKQEFALYSQPVDGGKATFITIGGYPVQPRWSPDGKRVYHTNNTNNTSGDWRQYAIAYVPAEGGDVTTVPIKSKDKIRIWGYGAGNRISPDGTTIVFAGQKSQEKNTILQIWTLPTAGGEPKQLTNAPAGFTDWYPCWSHDGKAVAFVRVHTSQNWLEDMMAGPNIYIIPAGGGQVRQLTSESDMVWSGPIAWSPDGNLIAFLSRDIKTLRESTIKVIPADGGDSRVIAKGRGEITWSPDSKRIAFHGSEERVIKIVSIEGGDIREINVDLPDTMIYNLDWSPDGTRLVFGGARGGGAEFWMMEDFLPEFTAGE